MCSSDLFPSHDKSSTTLTTSLSRRSIFGSIHIPLDLIGHTQFSLTGKRADKAFQLILFLSQPKLQLQNSFIPGDDSRILTPDNLEKLVPLIGGCSKDIAKFFILLLQFAVLFI